MRRQLLVKGSNRYEKVWSRRRPLRYASRLFRSIRHGRRHDRGTGGLLLDKGCIGGCFLSRVSGGRLRGGAWLRAGFVGAGRLAFDFRALGLFLKPIEERHKLAWYASDKKSRSQEVKNSGVAGVQELKDVETERDIVREVKWNLTQSYAKARQGHGSEQLTHFLPWEFRTRATCKAAGR